MTMQCKGTSDDASDTAMATGGRNFSNRNSNFTSNSWPTYTASTHVNRNGRFSEVVKSNDSTWTLGVDRNMRSGDGGESGNFGANQAIVRYTEIHPTPEILSDASMGPIKLAFKRYRR